MYNSNIPNDRELPSTAKLIKSTILAAVASILLLVTVVMPAEYGIDPTGIGNTLGLKRMGEIKMSLAKEAEAEAQEKTALDETSETPVATNSANPDSFPTRSEEIQVTLAPDEGTEVKVELKKDQKVEYVWSTNGGKANFDVHGDSKALSIDYHAYEKGLEQKMQGVIVAAFDGSHGWFWRNRTKEPVTITLKATGSFPKLKHIK